MSDQVSEKVMSIVASVKQIPPEAISIHSTFKEPGSDSLGAIDIVFELEDAFNVRIPDEQARSVRSLAEMIDGVRKLTGLASGAPPPGRLDLRMQQVAIMGLGPEVEVS
jgi:acyl carrier protein